jgi:hypothetical protein
MASGLAQILADVSDRVREQSGASLRVTRFEQHRTFDYMPLYSADRWLRWVPQNRGLVWRTAAARRAVAGPNDRTPPFALSIGLSGPAIVPGIAESDHMQALLLGLHAWGARHGRSHIEVALGSRWPIGSTPALNVRDAEFVRRAFASARWISSRDESTKVVLRGVGLDSTAIPDIAYQMPHVNRRTQGERILLNLQPDGANESLGRHEWNHTEWKRKARDLAVGLAKMGPVTLLAHSPKDEVFLRSLDTSMPVRRPSSVSEYLNLVRQARLLVATRIHAAVAAASQGVAAIGVGQDSRLGVLEAFGLRTFDASLMSVEMVLETAGEQWNGALDSTSDYLERKRRSHRQYVDRIESEVLQAMNG